MCEGAQCDAARKMNGYKFPSSTSQTSSAADCEGLLGNEPARWRGAQECEKWSVPGILPNVTPAGVGNYGSSDGLTVSKHTNALKQNLPPVVQGGKISCLELDSLEPCCGCLSQGILHRLERRIPVKACKLKQWERLADGPAGRERGAGRGVNDWHHELFEKGFQANGGGQPPPTDTHVMSRRTARPAAYLIIRRITMLVAVSCTDGAMRSVTWIHDHRRVRLPLKIKQH